MNLAIIGNSAVKIIHGVVNYVALMIVILLIAFAGYALWDSNQIYQTADKSNYTVYKPKAADGGKSFKELQDINKEVFAWLSVYGTNIDYPVTQGQDNMKYVNTDAEGKYSLSGSIFLDCHNNKDFSDFNNILYGHHMAKKAMFGEIGEFSSRDMFDSRRYGNLYFDGTDHGIEFFAFIHADAYDSAVFTAAVKETGRQAYLENLLTNALYTRDIGTTAEDRIILLSTCSSSSTNGRDILIGRIMDEVYEDSFTKTESNDKEERPAAGSPYGLVKELHLLWPLLLMLMLASRWTVHILVIYHSQKYQKGVKTHV